MNSAKPIYVIQFSLRQLEKIIPYLQEIWDKKALTNGDPFQMIDDR